MHAIPPAHWVFLFLQIILLPRSLRFDWNGCRANRMGKMHNFIEMHLLAEENFESRCILGLVRFGQA